MSALDASSYAWLAELYGLDGASYAWRAYGSCRDRPDLDWFPGRGAPTVDQKRVCAACPVREACLDAALANGERHGIWGGLSERERRSLRRTRGIGRPDTAAIVLGRLAEEPGGRWVGSLGDLAADMGAEARTVGHAVGRLEARGAVVVDPPAPRPVGSRIRSIAIAGCAS